MFTILAIGCCGTLYLVCRRMFLAELENPEPTFKEFVESCVFGFATHLSGGVGLYLSTLALQKIEGGEYGGFFCNFCQVILAMYIVTRFINRHDRLHKMRLRCKHFEQQRAKQT